MLETFGKIKRRCEKVRGYALNPLSSGDVSKVLHSLGYETSPPKDFGFVKKNIHFATACAPGAKQRLSKELKDIIRSLPPDEPGVVRISTEPLGVRKQCELAYEDRYFDAPAVRYAPIRSNDANRVEKEVTNLCGPIDSDESTVPRVVPLDKGFAESGHGVVLALTGRKVGCNGITFRKRDACAEMRHTSSPLVRRTWPREFLELYEKCRGPSEPVFTYETPNYAPANWTARKPVSHFSKDYLDWKARFPPRNRFNSSFEKGPREEGDWVPVATMIQGNLLPRTLSFVPQPKSLTSVTSFEILPSTAVDGDII